VLATPGSLAQVGLTGGLIGLVSIGLVNTYTMQLQVAASNRLRGDVRNYSELMHAAFGDNGKLMINIFILICQLAYSTANLLFVIKQFDNLLCLESRGEICGNINSFAVMYVLFITPISLIERFDILAMFLGTTNILLLFVYAIIMSYGYQFR